MRMEKHIHRITWKHRHMFVLAYAQAQTHRDPTLRTNVHRSQPLVFMLRHMHAHPFPEVHRDRCVSSADRCPGV